MGIVLFDWKNTSTAKKIVNTSLPNGYLFDGYLTETTTYQQLPQKSLFDWKNTSTTKKAVNASLPNGYLFDGYLTETTTYQHFTQMVYLTVS